MNSSGTLTGDGVPDQPPRRRMSDRDRRRWTDNALDMLKQQMDSNAEEIADLRAELRAVARLPPEVAAFRREFDDWKTERREDIREFRNDIAELQKENKLAHKRIAHGKDP